jgi:hypothetical protein
MNTIVSAFVSSVNNRYNDSITRYYNYGKLLLQSTVPKIIFVDEIMFDLIQEGDYDKKNNVIVKINKKQSYLYNYAEHLTTFQLNSTDYSKDTIEFMFTMCNKTEWIKQMKELYNCDFIDYNLLNITEKKSFDVFKKLYNKKSQKTNYLLTNMRMSICELG